MIAYLEGVLAQSGPVAVLTVGDGVGLEVHLSARSAAGLPPVGERVRLWTQLIVREDAWTLHGFLSPAEREMFRLLISVSGIGPKVASSMLGAASPDDIAVSLRTGDEKGLARLPGIGKKSAARLIVELAQRLPEQWTAPVSSGGAANGAAGPPADEELFEAVAILAAMGLSAAQAERALITVRSTSPAETADLQQWVKAALRRL